MRPTFSIIAFTVLSGAGYGLWFLVGLGLALHWPACGPAWSPDGSPSPLPLCRVPTTLAYGGLAGFVLVSAGLLSSLGHLGRPKRAWRALSQWRSSWLSREGIAALLTYLPAAGIALQALATRWPMRNAIPAESFQPWLDDRLLRPFGALLALGALLTVFCTANIYASLKPIRAWHQRCVMPGYLLLGLYGGALLLWAADATSGGSMARSDGQRLLAGLIVLAMLCAALKQFYWRQVDRLPTADAGHATGLDRLGSVCSFEQPHTEENYLTHEMGFVLARRHSRQLRAIALSTGFLVPALSAALALAFPSLRTPAAWLALAFGMLGILVERWLFFAEAKHAVMAYYRRA